MNRIRYYAAVSVILPAVAVLIWPTQQWLLVIFLIWTLAAAVLWNRSLAREQAWQIEQLELTMQQTAIATLNHHRHDWMNDLQIIYGYSRMGKTDKTIQCVEQIKERMMTESKLAKLGIPSLVLFLQSFRTLTNAMVIDLEIDGELNLAELFPGSKDQVANTIIELIQAYRYAAVSGSGNAAKLLMDVSADEEKLHLAFHLDGELRPGSEWKTNCDQALQRSPLKAAGVDEGKGMLMLEAQIGK
ncbi:histidine kinase [Paenibacillus rhizovicinus]|uniref:Histidine kinase n=1 Tax=Paenibacillus rhizovicinus TaxID=2704463 RepID=A0A6C0P988_9BACL|nr:Spo0B domain-containing protein [Paenibacillus rhizovicinus]QHW34183.1 histidine kinase [Paenibacillus rhizovicinus]